jgi:hypothetical protein
MVSSDQNDDDDADDDEGEAIVDQNYLLCDALCFLLPLMMRNHTPDECGPICCVHISTK